MSGADGWRTVTNRDPCEICERVDWCSRSDDGKAVVCGRTDANAPQAGWRFLRQAKDGRPIFQRERERRGATSSKNGRARQAPKRAPDRDAALDWAREIEALPTPNDDDLDVLARKLCVLRVALLALGVRRVDNAALRRWHAGFAGDGPYPSAAWAFPERDGRGRIVGVSLRADDGRKGAPARARTGSRRGLVYDPIALAQGGPVLIVEGASDVAACLTVQRCAVGRPSNMAGAEDLGVLLRDRDVLIVAERDEKPGGRWPGREGAMSLAQDLANACGRPVRWTLPPKGAKDARAWLRSLVADGLVLDDADALLAAGIELVGALKAAAETLPRGDQQAADVAAPWTPYPVHVLPEPLRSLATEGAAAIGCDPAYIAAASLASCAGAIGLSRNVQVKHGWTEPPTLWAALVGESGSAKSPALDLAVAPLRKLEREARVEHERAMRAYESERGDRESRRKARQDAGDAPAEPGCPRVVAGDATIEAVGIVLARSPRQSVVVVRDELAALFRGWDAYRDRGGAEAAKWLELHAARELAVDRVSRPAIYVPRATASIVGGIQPGPLVRALGVENLENGCAARFLLAMPPRIVRRWTDAKVAPRTLAKYERVVSALHGLEPDRDGEALRPVELPLAPEAQEIMRAHYDALGELAVDLVGAEAAAAAKLEGGAARLALVIALVEAAARGGENRLAAVPGWAMAAGVELARWHLAEARRIYAVLGIGRDAAAEADPLDALGAWLDGRGAAGATVREVARGPRGYRGAGGAERAERDLEALASAGRAIRHPGPRGPRFVSTSAGDRPRAAETGDGGDGDTWPRDTPVGAESVAVAASPQGGSGSAPPEAEPDIDGPEGVAPAAPRSGPRAPGRWPTAEVSIWSEDGRLHSGPLIDSQTGEELAT